MRWTRRRRRARSTVSRHHCLHAWSGLVLESVSVLKSFFFLASASLLLLLFFHYSLTISCLISLFRWFFPLLSTFCFKMMMPLPFFCFACCIMTSTQLISPITLSGFIFDAYSFFNPKNRFGFFSAHANALSIYCFISFFPSRPFHLLLSPPLPLRFRKAGQGRLVNWMAGTFTVYFFFIFFALALVSVWFLVTYGCPSVLVVSLVPDPVVTRSLRIPIFTLLFFCSDLFCAFALFGVLLM